MPNICFTYSSGMPRAAGGGGVMGPCFSYPAGVGRRGLHDLRRVPEACFSYPAEVNKRTFAP